MAKRKKNDASAPLFEEKQAVRSNRTKSPRKRKKDASVAPKGTPLVETDGIRSPDSSKVPEMPESTDATQSSGLEPGSTANNHGTPRPKPQYIITNTRNVHLLLSFGFYFPRSVQSRIGEVYVSDGSTGNADGVLLFDKLYAELFKSSDTNIRPVAVEVFRPQIDTSHPLVHTKFVAAWECGSVLFADEKSRADFVDREKPYNEAYQMWSFDVAHPDAWSKEPCPAPETASAGSGSDSTPSLSTDALFGLNRVRGAAALLAYPETSEEFTEEAGFPAGLRCYALAGILDHQTPGDDGPHGVLPSKLERPDLVQHLTSLLCNEARRNESEIGALGVSGWLSKHIESALATRDYSNDEVLALLDGLVFTCVVAKAAAVRHTSSDPVLDALQEVQVWFTALPSDPSVSSNSLTPPTLDRLRRGVSFALDVIEGRQSIHSLNTLEHHYAGIAAVVLFSRQVAPSRLLASAKQGGSGKARYSAESILARTSPVFEAASVLLRVAAGYIWGYSLLPADIKRDAVSYTFVRRASDSFLGVPAAGNDQPEIQRGTVSSVGEPGEILWDFTTSVPTVTLAPTVARKVLANILQGRPIATHVLGDWLARHSLYPELIGTRVVASNPRTRTVFSEFQNNGLCIELDVPPGGIRLEAVASWEMFIRKAKGDLKRDPFPLALIAINELKNLQESEHGTS